jgi:hypothetical protein
VGSLNNSSIINCYSTGEIIGNNNVGGMVGTAENNIMILNSYSISAVSGAFSTGGLVGSLWNNCSIQNCYAVESVNGGDGSVGGIVGFAGNSSTTIENCVALNPVVSAGMENASGRVVGYNDYSTLINNAAYDGMLNYLGNSTWNNIGATNSDGENMSKEMINVNGSLGERFSEANGWTVQNGKLPGLFGSVVEMPEHLKLLNINMLPILIWNVFPNPTTDKIYIKLNTSEKVDYYIYNTLGQTILQGKLQEGLSINIQFLPSGIYYLRVLNKTARVVKN